MSAQITPLNCQPPRLFPFQEGECGFLDTDFVTGDKPRKVRPWYASVASELCPPDCARGSRARGGRTKVAYTFLLTPHPALCVQTNPPLFARCSCG